MNIGKPIARRAADWAMNHPKTMFGGVMAASAIASRPFKGVGSMLQEDVLGSPSAISTMATQYSSDVWQEHWNSPYEQQKISSFQSSYGGYSAVDGSMVFGMYNSRMSG